VLVFELFYVCGGGERGGGGGREAGVNNKNCQVN